MKISNKLRVAIIKSNLNSRQVLTDKIDELFRNDKINREIWSELFKLVLEESSKNESNILARIYSYRGKR